MRVALASKLTLARGQRQARFANNFTGSVILEQRTTYCTGSGNNENVNPGMWVTLRGVFSRQEGIQPARVNCYFLVKTTKEKKKGNV